MARQYVSIHVYRCQIIFLTRRVVAFVSINIPLTFLIPETLIRSKILDPTIASSEGSQDIVHPSASSLKHRITAFLTNAKETHFVFKSPMLLALSITFLFQSLSGRSSEMLYQLASERFHWSVPCFPFFNIPNQNSTTYLPRYICFKLRLFFMSIYISQAWYISDICVEW